MMCLLFIGPRIFVACCFERVCSSFVVGSCASCVLFVVGYWLCVVCVLLVVVCCLSCGDVSLLFVVFCLCLRFVVLFGVRCWVLFVLWPFMSCVCCFGDLWLLCVV